MVFRIATRSWFLLATVLAVRLGFALPAFAEDISSGSSVESAISSLSGGTSPDAQPQNGSDDNSASLKLEPSSSLNVIQQLGISPSEAMKLKNQFSSGS